MKKIIALTIAAVMILAMAGVGTYAFFSDTETSEDNTLTAGTLDLKVDNGDDAVITFAQENIKPGDTGSDSTTLTNAGSLAGDLFVEVSDVTNTEGTSVDFQSGGSGDLGGVVEIAIYIDVDGEAGFGTGDIGLKSDGSIYTGGSTATDADLLFNTINEYEDVKWQKVDATTTTKIATMDAEDEYVFVVKWKFPETDTDQNVCQGDEVSMDFTFELMQAGYVPPVPDPDPEP